MRNVIIVYTISKCVFRYHFVSYGKGCTQAHNFIKEVFFV